MGTPETVAIHILHEDSAIIVVNKPSGIVVHPGVKNTSGTLMDMALAHTLHLSDSAGDDRRGIVHRLDQYTQGVMVMAKTNDAHDHLSQQFRDRRVIKKYYAMVRGDMTSDHGSIDQPLIRHPKNRLKYCVSNSVGQGREALTKYYVLKRYNTKTLLELHPKTGRTHQLRVHLSSIGHPIIGDPLYNPKKWQGNGQLLQAFYLEFSHPNTEETVRFTVDISDQLK